MGLFSKMPQLPHPIASKMATAPRYAVFKQIKEGATISSSVAVGTRYVEWEGYQTQTYLVSNIHLSQCFLLNLLTDINILGRAIDFYHHT